MPMNWSKKKKKPAGTEPGAMDGFASAPNASLHDAQFAAMNPLARIRTSKKGGSSSKSKSSKGEAGSPSTTTTAATGSDSVARTHRRQRRSSNASQRRSSNAAALASAEAAVGSGDKTERRQARREWRRSEAADSAAAAASAAADKNGVQEVEDAGAARAAERKVRRTSAAYLARRKRRRSEAADTASVEAAAAVVAAEEEPVTLLGDLPPHYGELPPGWVEHDHIGDDGSSCPYYHNEATDETTWIRPTIDDDHEPTEVELLVKELFAIVDVDNSGELEMGELLMMERKLAKATKHEFDEARSLALLERVDTNGSGTISIKEYTRAVLDLHSADHDGADKGHALVHLFTVHDADSMRHQIDYLTNQSAFDDALRHVFLMIDKDMDGRITREEEKLVNLDMLRAIAPAASDEVIARDLITAEEVGRRVDVDHDGYVSFAEFANKWYELESVVLAVDSIERAATAHDWEDAHTRDRLIVGDVVPTTAHAGTEIKHECCAVQ